MILNSNFSKKRKLNTLNTLKLFKNIKENKQSNNEEDEEEQESPIKLPEIFGKSDENNLIYLKENHLYFHTEVSENSVDEVKKLLRQYWNKFDKIMKSHTCVEFKPKPLYLHIFSPGGCVYSGFSLYDFIIEYKKKIPIYTVVEGRVASAATFISVAGTKRFMTPNSYILIHQLVPLVLFFLFHPF